MTIADGDDEEIIGGTEGEDTTGQDAPAGDEDGEVPAEQPDAEEDDGEQEVDATPARPSRGESRIQRLANQARAAEERAARAEAAAEEARRASLQRQQDQSEEARQARRALMTPEERINDDMQLMQRGFAHQLQQQQQMTAAMLDRAAYEAKAATNGIYAKYRDVIEEQFQRQLAQGRPVEREILLQNHLGKLALERAGNPGPARKAARARVDAQRVSPGSGKGDTQANRGKAGNTAESRLKDVHI